jgi:hypothetical protein
MPPNVMTHYSSNKRHEILSFLETEHRVPLVEVAGTPPLDTALLENFNSSVDRETVGAILAWAQSPPNRPSLEVLLPFLGGPALEALTPHFLHGGFIAEEAVAPFFGVFLLGSLSWSPEIYNSLIFFEEMATLLEAWREMKLAGIHHSLSLTSAAQAQSLSLAVAPTEIPGRPLLFSARTLGLATLCSFFGGSLFTSMEMASLLPSLPLIQTVTETTTLSLLPEETLGLPHLWNALLACLVSGLETLRVSRD